MSAFVVAMACVHVLCREPSGVHERRYLESLGGVRYEFRITGEMLDKTPAWLAEQEHPPLSPRKALAAADKVFHTLLKDYPLDEKHYPKARWGLASIDLTPGFRAERWIWTVRYECAPMRAADRTQRFRVFVLMDGTAVQPIKDQR